MKRHSSKTGDLQPKSQRIHNYTMANTQTRFLLMSACILVTQMTKGEPETYCYILCSFVHSLQRLIKDVSSKSTSMKFSRYQHGRKDDSKLIIERSEWPRGTHVIVIVIVNSWFLERPQKRSRRNQLIHRRLTKTKSIGSGQDPESGRQADS